MIYSVLKNEIKMINKQKYKIDKNKILAMFSESTHNIRDNKKRNSTRSRIFDLSSIMKSILGKSKVYGKIIIHSSIFFFIQ